MKISAKYFGTVVGP